MYSIHYHNLRQREIKIKLVLKFLNQKSFEPQHIHYFIGIIFYDSLIYVPPEIYKAMEMSVRRPS